MARFRCYHCGSKRPPRSFIDQNGSHNSELFTFLMLVTVLSCCTCFPVLFLYPLLALRKHRCAECGLTLE